MLKVGLLNLYVANKEVTKLMKELLHLYI